MIHTHKRHQSEQRALRSGRTFPQIDQRYHRAALGGECGRPAKFSGPSFYKISNQYFAEEAPRNFAVEAAVFSALILTAILPIVNSIQAVATLIHSVGVL